MSVETTLSQRERTHGDFEKTAAIAQVLKSIFSSHIEAKKVDILPHLKSKPSK